jgi:hypothetical protein
MKRSLNFAMIDTVMTMAILVIGVGLAVELTAQSAFAMTMMPGNQTNGKMMSGNVTSGMMKGNESGGKMMSGNVTIIIFYFHFGYQAGRWVHWCGPIGSQLRAHRYMHHFQEHSPIVTISSAFHRKIMVKKVFEAMLSIYNSLSYTANYNIIL